MPSPSKKEHILELFLNEPSKQWHFEEILKSCHISRSKAVKWLSVLVKENLIKRMHPRGRMPYYQSDFDNPSYRNRKRIFALEKIYKTGLLDHLLALPKAKTVIIFGSYARADWHTESDVDIFIFGSDYGLDIGSFEKALKRNLQVFTAKDHNELERFRHGLLQNIINGYRIKGDIDELIHTDGKTQDQ